MSFLESTLSWFETTSERKSRSFILHRSGVHSLFRTTLNRNVYAYFGLKYHHLEHCSGLQVGKLYIRYELSDSELVEVQNVNCVLNNGKELYIQKNHLTAKLDICRCVSEAKVSSCYQFPHCNWLGIMATQLSELAQLANATHKIKFSPCENKSAPSPSLLH